MRYELYLLKYNNFLERKSYVGHSINYLLSIATKYIPVNGDNNKTSINIKFNDGIYADLGPLVVNDNNNTMLMYNYAIVYDTLTETYTRWFILPGSSMLSGNKFTCRLNRDTIAENYVEIANSKGYIERGILTDSSPLSLIKENFSCNQIKYTQFPIVDFTQTAGYPWLKRREHILCFIDRKQLTEDITISINNAPDYTLEVSSLSDYEYYSFVGNMTTTNEQYFQCKDQDLTIIKHTYTDNNNTIVSDYYQVSFEDYSDFNNNIQGKLKLYKIDQTPSITFTLGMSWMADTILNSRNPYVIVAIPFWDDGTSNVGSSKLRIYGYMILNSLLDKFGSALFDIQLTPYSSGEIAKCKEIPGSLNYFPLRLINETFYSTATLNYTENITGNNNQNKILVNTKDYYIKSPTGTNSYNFNIAYYNRAISKAYISATYKPYNSIVNIKLDKGTSPYVANVGFNDNIELSFSLPHLTRYDDAWTQYQLNNKNYKEIFENQVNKQIENAIVGGIGGVASGAASGAALGSIIPGVGTAIGAVVGAVGGAVSGIVGGIGTARDVQYQKADFEMQIGNIKAQPRSLSSVSEMDFSYKGFAYIEVYDTTDAEKSLFLAFYSRVSYTVNTYEGLNSYITGYWGTNLDKPVFFKGYIMQLADGYYISPNELLDINAKLSNGYYIIHSNDPA